MIALEVSSAAGRPPIGGIGGAIRAIVGALLAVDPETRYALCYRLSRWRKGHLFAPDAPNARVRVIQDPLNGLLLPGVRLLHSMGIFVPRTPRVTKLVTVHDLNAVRNSGWVRPEWHERRSAKIRRVVEAADHVVTYSAFTAGEVREEYGLPEDRVHPVLLGVDTERFRPPSTERIEALRREHGDYLISIGLLTPRKNFPTLIRALAHVKDARLLLVGRATDGAEEIERAIDGAGVRDRIVRMERVPHEELVELIGAARAYAVPSLYEGFGLTVLEAMACGTPVVCSKAASLPEVAGNAALLVDATDEESLGEALARVLEDTSLAKALREKGLARAAEMTWHQSATTLRTLYHQLT